MLTNWNNIICYYRAKVMAHSVNCSEISKYKADIMDIVF